MRIPEFEAAVLEVEEIVVRVRAPVGTELDDYEYERQAAAETSVTEWLHTRVIPKLHGNQVCVIDGNSAQPHGRTKLRTLRASYDR